MSPSRAQCLKEKYNIDIHSLKPGGGYDLFLAANGDIVVKPLSGAGPGDPTGYNMDSFPGC
jgi:hypothetical protein